MTTRPPSQPSHASRRLATVQALRGLAALWVVLYHAAAIWREGVGAPTGSFAGPWDQGYAGVDLFFVISGFVMVWSAGSRARGAGTALAFLRDRAWRIYPLWWVFCTLMALYFLVSYGQPASPAVVGAEAAWAYLGVSLTLWPQAGMPVLPLGWTLSFEMAFYGVFALALLAPTHWRGGLALLWAGAILAALALRPAAPLMPGDPLSLLLHPLCLEFLLGAAAAWAVRRWHSEPEWARFLALMGALSLGVWAVIGLDPAAPDFAASRVLVYGVPGALLVAGLARAEGGRLRVPSALRRLGNASYSLYLGHFLVLLALRRVLDWTGWLSGPSWLSLVLFTIAGAALSLLAARLSYRILERPLMARRRRRKALRAAAQTG